LAWRREQERGYELAEESGADAGTDNDSRVDESEGGEVEKMEELSE
jgi:hypothetical protein